MRRSTALLVVLTVVCGGFLFKTSQQVTDGRDRLAVLNQQIADEQESLRVLNAEWSYLNQPERLEKLSAQYLRLSPQVGKQFATWQDFDKPPEPPVADAGKKTSIAAAKVPATVAAKSSHEAATAVAAPRKPAVPKETPRISPYALYAARLANRRPEATYVPPSVVRVPPSSATASASGARSFGDVMHSLGVQR